MGLRRAHSSWDGIGLGGRREIFVLSRYLIAANASLTSRIHLLGGIANLWGIQEARSVVLSDASWCDDEHLTFMYSKELPGLY